MIPRVVVVQLMEPCKHLMRQLLINVALFEAAADEILNRGLDYLTTMPQNISNTIWAHLHQHQHTLKT